MRNVITTVASLDVPDDYSEAVEEILSDIHKVGQVLRRTYEGQEGTSERYETRLVTYPAPGTGQTVYAVDDEDPATHEVEETADEAEATARYEEVVRDRAAAMTVDAEGNEELLDYSDVEGVPAKENPTAPTRGCVCGYEADGQGDLGEHIVAAARADGEDHAERH